VRLVSSLSLLWFFDLFSYYERTFVRASSLFFPISPLSSLSPLYLSRSLYPWTPSLLFSALCSLDPPLSPLSSFPALSFLLFSVLFPFSVGLGFFPYLVPPGNLSFLFSFFFSLINSIHLFDTPAVLLSVCLIVVWGFFFCLVFISHLWWVLLNAVLLQKTKLPYLLNLLDTTILRLWLS
jgi:hypothetical protein